MGVHATEDVTDPIKLSKLLKQKRVDRPDELLMDDLARMAKTLEDDLEETRVLLFQATLLLSETRGSIVELLEEIRS